jgi:hypothetical protein
VSEFKRAFGWGAGLAAGWVVMLFVMPILFIGGCAALIIASSSGTSNGKDAQPFSHADATVLGRRARTNVLDLHSRASHASSRCKFVRRDTLGPDSWDYDCLITATIRHKPVRFRQGVQCFDPPHYRTFDAGSCTLDGDPVKL